LEACSILRTSATSSSRWPPLISSNSRPFPFSPAPNRGTKAPSPGATPPPGTGLGLTRLAFADMPKAQFELDRHARTVDSLEERRIDDAIFILGSDELADFSTWKQPERVLELARLAVVRRPGVSDERIREARAGLSAPDRILSFDMQAIPVSSSEIRERVARGESIEGLVPVRVAEAIVRLGLYVDG